ncbi:MAG: ATP-dependent DNA helicase pcrA [candidate division TM6 bacterium GW2011_GWF2_43_17]|nr:MAG: ATP-dependent DNA helicase pcrA [candidate division TM6 bacterium GW2011_GWF2_43_17]
MKSILEKLNQEQIKAVKPRAGIFLVRAGAGSGKTRVITMRMAYLCLEHGVDPLSITALTFTNKAATEMKERMAQLLPSREALPFLGTFHSFCLRFLKRNRKYLQFPDFSILDRTDQEKIIKGLLTQSGLNKQMTYQNVLHAISQAKNQAVEGIVNPYGIEHPLVRELFVAYEQEKEKARCIDFDDLLLQTIRLLRTNSSLRENTQQQMQHILVDEYQDTNKIQDTLLRLLSCDNSGKCSCESLCVVGDEDQSIYAWRGAVVSNILNFPHNFPNTQEITLAQNYRSVQPILNLANELIKNNYGRKEKNLWSEKVATNRVKILAVSSDRQESTIATKALAKALERELECAVLYRSHHQSRIIEESLLYHSIPYQIIGGIQFYEREEVKDLLAYLRLTINPFDRIAAKRILNVPLRGLGPKVEVLLLATWDSEPLLDFYQIAQTLGQILPPLKKQKLEDLISCLQQLSPGQEPTRALEHIISHTDYLAYLKTQHEKEKAEEKIANVKELVTTAYAAEERGITTTASFIDEIGLLQEFSKKNEASRHKHVTLMTLHAAKGLEFDFVVLPGLEDGLLPAARSAQDPESLEEERRLLYVGITRAREYVLITHAEQRALYGYITSQTPSRFLAEIEQQQNMLERTAYWSSLQISQFLSNWLENKKTNTRINEFASLVKKTCSADPFAKSQFIPAIKGAPWKRLQPVTHTSFGTGIIRHIETRTDGKVILTIAFAQGEKKIDANFVTPT